MSCWLFLGLSYGVVVCRARINIWSVRIRLAAFSIWMPGNDQDLSNYALVDWFLIHIFLAWAAVGPWISGRHVRYSATALKAKGVLVWIYMYMCVACMSIPEFQLCATMRTHRSVHVACCVEFMQTRIHTVMSHIVKSLPQLLHFTWVVCWWMGRSKCGFHSRWSGCPDATSL